MKSYNNHYYLHVTGEQRGVVGQSRVVDHDVQGGELVPDELEQLCDVILVADVTPPRKHPARTLLVQLVRNRLNN